MLWLQADLRNTVGTFQFLKARLGGNLTYGLAEGEFILELHGHAGPVSL